MPFVALLPRLPACRRLLPGGGAFVCAFLLMLFLLLPVKGRGQEFPAITSMPPGISPAMLDTAAIRQLIDQGKSAFDINPDSGIALLKESLTRSNRSGYTEGIIRALKFLGEAYVNKGEPDSCLWLCRQAFHSYSLSPQFRQVLPSVYNILGNVYKIRGDYRKAAAHYFKAISLSRQSGATHADGAYNNLATVFISLEQYPEALRHLEKAAVLARRHGHYEALGYALLNKGLVYGRQQEWAAAASHLDSALRVAETYGLTQLHYLSLAHTGGVYLQRKMYREALHYLSRAQALKGTINPDYQVFALLLAGEAYDNLGQYKPAEACLLQALYTARSHNLNQLPARALLAQVYKKQGRYREALVHFEAYKQLDDEIRGQEVAQHINRLDISYHTAEKDKKLAQDQLLISDQKSRLKTQRLWITGVSACAVILGLCLWMLYRTDRHRQQLAEKQQEIRRLKAVVEGEEKERSRIARELHDGIVSQLMAVRLGIQLLQERDGIILPEELAETHTQLREAADDLRRAVHNLIPDTVQEHGLARAVGLLCEKTEKNSSLEVTLEMFDDIPRYDADMELSTFRIIQELVQNALKHAKASSLLVQLSYRDDTLHITVEDDGIGIPEQRTGSGAGLKNIMNRIRAMNGVISVEKPAGGGTAVYIEHRINITPKNIAHAC